MSSSADFSAIASDLADESTVFLDLDVGPQKEKILNYLIAKAVETGRATDSDGIVAAALKREEKAPTGLPGGIAIPHCRHEDWSMPTLMFARLTSATEFTTPDGPADLLFFIGVPASNSDVHVDILAALAKALRLVGKRKNLRQRPILSPLRPAPRASLTLIWQPKRLLARQKAWLMSR